MKRRALLEFALALALLGCGTTGEGPRDAAVEASPPRPAKGGAIYVDASAYTIQEKIYATTAVGARFADARSPACVVTAAQGGACTTTVCPGAVDPPTF